MIVFGTMIWQVQQNNLNLSTRGMIMGILNATPDSFSDGGHHDSTSQALAHALTMIAEGADIIDIGGESTRPGAVRVGVIEEIERVIPVIKALREKWSGLISIDTTKAAVAEQALRAGASIVNDISGLREDPGMLALCQQSDCGIVIMHMRGNPQNMQQNPQYLDVVAEVRSYFEERLQCIKQAGISPERICFDPGIGFGKTAEHNWQLIEHLMDLQVEDRPLLLGVSRKSFIAQRLGTKDMSQRSWPTIGLTAFGRQQGAMIHRVHEVKGNREALRMTEAIMLDC